MAITSEREVRATLTDYLDAWLDLYGGQTLDEEAATAVLAAVTGRGLLPTRNLAALPPEQQPAELRQWLYSAAGWEHCGFVLDAERLVPVSEVRIEPYDVKQFHDDEWTDTKLPWPDLQSHTGCLKYLGYTGLHEIEDGGVKVAGVGVGVRIYRLRDDTPPRVEGTPNFYASVSLGFDIYEVALPLWLDVLRLMRFLGPAITADIQARQDANLCEHLAYHRDRPSDRCSHCRLIADLAAELEA